MGAVYSSLAVVFLVLTVLATLGVGEHYLFDSIVAIPYSVPALVSLLRPRARTWRAPQPVQPCPSLARTSVHSH
jgi:hypothetical protein